MHDAGCLDVHLEQVLLKRINYRRPLDHLNLCCDYFDPNLPYLSLPASSPDILSKATSICEKIACSCFSNDKMSVQLAEIVGLTVIPEMVTKIWSLCRILSMEDGHFLWIGRRSAAEEVIQIACAIRQIRLIEVSAVQEDFYTMLQEEIAKLATAKRPEHVALYLDLSQIKDEKWLLLLQSMLMDDIGDWSLFTEQTPSEKPNNWITRSPFHLAKRFLHVVLIADTELQLPLKPRVVEQCDMLRDEFEPLEWMEIARKYIEFRGVLEENVRVKCAVALEKMYQVVEKTFAEYKNEYIGMELIRPKSMIIEEFMGPKRFLEIIDLTTSLYTRLKTALQAKISHFERMHSAASDFQ